MTDLSAIRAWAEMEREKATPRPISQGGQGVMVRDYAADTRAKGLEALLAILRGMNDER